MTDCLCSSVQHILEALAIDLDNDVHKISLRELRSAMASFAGKAHGPFRGAGHSSYTYTLPFRGGDEQHTHTYTHILYTPLSFPRLGIERRLMDVDGMTAHDDGDLRTLMLVQCSVIMTGNEAVRQGKCFGGAHGANPSAAGKPGMARRLAHIRRREVPSLNLPPILG
jgi:hypothetical protein